MSNRRSVDEITQATEEIVRQYFAQKNWSSQKLDKPRKNALKTSDWLFCYDKLCFLCEVKTITSVRRGLYTEAHFTQFDQIINTHFSRLNWSGTPLTVSIHSDTLYQPSATEAGDFINWLESALLTLRDDKFVYGWTRDVMPWGGKLYTAHYAFGTTPQGKTPAFSLNVSTTTNSDRLEIKSYIYGDFHVDKIDELVQIARGQLEETAKRQPNPTIPRVVVLAFDGTSGGGIDFDWQIACQRISELLAKHQNISAIALMSSTNIEKYEGDDIIDWIAHSATSPIVPYFIVFHNRWLARDINELDLSAFSDDYSVQLWPICSASEMEGSPLS